MNRVSKFPCVIPSVGCLANAGLCGVSVAGVEIDGAGAPVGFEWGYLGVLERSPSRTSLLGSPFVLEGSGHVSAAWFGGD